MSSSTNGRGEPLAQQLRAAIEQRGSSVERLAERTKVPRGTLRVLLGDGIAAVLPPRVYLRGQVGLIAGELGLELEQVMSAFDETFPPNEEIPITGDLPRLRLNTTAIAVAGIAGVGILAVILAFAH